MQLVSVIIFHIFAEMLVGYFNPLPMQTPYTAVSEETLKSACDFFGGSVQEVSGEIIL